MQKELDVITQPLKEANWTMFKRVLKTIPLVLIGVAVGFAGAHFAHQQYRYTYYLDTETREMAQTMQAMCDATGKCDKGQLLQTFSQIASEGQLFNNEGTPAPGK